MLFCFLFLPRLLLQRSSAGSYRWQHCPGLLEDAEAWRGLFLCQTGNINVSLAHLSGLLWGSKERIAIKVPWKQWKLSILARHYYCGIVLEIVGWLFLYPNIINCSIKMRERMGGGDSKRKGERRKDLIWAWLVNIYIRLLLDYFIQVRWHPSFLTCKSLLLAGTALCLLLPHHWGCSLYR